MSAAFPEPRAPNRVDVWRRDPHGPFDDLAREQFAQERAKGRTIKQAAQVSGIALTTASQFAKDERMYERIRELRQGADQFVGVSVAWVLQQLRKNAEEAREVSAFKASNEAIGMIYKIISEDKSVASNMARTLPADVSRSDLQKMLRASFAQNTQETAQNTAVIDTAGGPGDDADARSAEDEEEVA